MFALIAVCLSTFVIVLESEQVTKEEATSAPVVTSDVPAVFDTPTDEELAKISKPALRVELLKMAHEDQTFRRSGSCAGKAKSTDNKCGQDSSDAEAEPEDENVDVRNTKRMKKIIEQHGWPTKAMVGADGARSAWLLVQHADHDVAFQRKCLSLMSAHKESGQVSSGDIAYLTDRVLVNEGKDQVYGTQFHVVEGVHQPRPIRDAEKVDERRKSMGLTTLEEYKKIMRT